MAESKVILGDCMDFMKECEDKAFDLAIVDPPYGINAPNMQMGSNPNRSRNDGFGSGPGVSTAVKLKGRLNSGSGKLKNRLLNTSSISWDNTKPSPEYFKELFRISRDQIIWGGNYFDLPPTRCIVCWDKMQPWDNFSQWEMAWTSFDMPAKLFRLSNTGGNNLEEKIHPTQKPVKLYNWILREFAQPNGYRKILSTHVGSGSDRIAVDGYGMTFTGCEIDPTHHAAQEKRFLTYKSQLKLFHPLNQK